MNNLKTFLVKSAATVILLALVCLNLNMGILSTPSWDNLGFSMLVQTAHANSPCPTCPDSDELYMDIHFCDTGKATLRCKRGGSGCDVSGQTTCKH